MIKTVAVIGLGAMGAPMAMNVHRHGFAVAVCDRANAALRSFDQYGVRQVARPSDCADCDAVLVVVATPEQVRSVLFGEDGLKAGLGVRKPLVVIMSTIAPETVQQLARELAEEGVRVIDAPVSGGPLGAEAGTLSIIMGGRVEDCEAAAPLMKAMGSQVFRCGSLGAGQATKIVNNLVCIANMMIAAEAYRIAQENNIVLDDAMAVFEASTGRNFFTSQPSQAAQAYGAWTRSREGFDTLQGLLRKDVDLALSMGRHVGPLPMAQALQSVLKDVGEETFATWRAIASP